MATTSTQQHLKSVVASTKFERSSKGQRNSRPHARRNLVSRAQPSVAQSAAVEETLTLKPIKKIYYVLMEHSNIV